MNYSIVSADMGITTIVVLVNRVMKTVGDLMASWEIVQGQILTNAKIAGEIKFLMMIQDTTRVNAKEIQNTSTLSLVYALLAKIKNVEDAIPMNLLSASSVWYTIRLAKLASVPIVAIHRLTQAKMASTQKFARRTIKW